MSLVVWPILLPLVAAALSQAFNRHPVVQRVLSVTTLVATVVVASFLVASVDSNGMAVAHIGGWQAPIGITIAADRLSAVLVLVSSTMLLAVLVYAMGSPRTADRTPFFHPVYLIMAAGIAGSFLTADLFNLFVFFEIMLTASYVLITLGGRHAQVRHGMTYVVISLLSSTLFLTGIGLVYAATGTVNMADLAVKLGELDPSVQAALSGFFFVVFGIKAAIFPLFFWLPDSYPTAPTPITAIFAGLLTKVGVYAMIRTQTLLFPSEGPSWLILTIAGLTMLIGALGAIAQDDIKRILSFHIISQIGYMVFGLGLFSVVGLAATTFYIIHHIIVKTTLFLIGGLIEETTGTGQLHRIGGLLHSAPGLAVMFLISALSLAGLPPFSGFIAKLGLIEAGMTDEMWLIVAMALAVSLLTMLSMTKIWTGAFWGRHEEPPPIPESMEVDRIEFPTVMMSAAAAATIISLTVAIMAGPLFDYAERAAADLADPSIYTTGVLGR